MEITSLSRKKGNCVVCGKSDHYAPQCKHRAKNDYPPKESLARGRYNCGSRFTSKSCDKCEQMGGRL